MKGSKVQNIKFDKKKQKLVACEGCGKEIIVGKFAKNNQRQQRRITGQARTPPWSYGL